MRADDPEPIRERRSFREDPVVVEFPNRHAIKGIEVVLECECGDLFSGDTEVHAIYDWEVHVQDEAEGP